ADQLDRADRRRQVAYELREVLALERAAEDQSQRRVERSDAAPGRGGVRRLRVVDVANAAELAHELESVRDALEGPQRLGDGRVLDPGGARGSRRSRRVLAVVRAGDERLGRQRVVGGEGDPRQIEPARDDRGSRTLEDAQLRVA